VRCADTVARKPPKPLLPNDGGREEIPQLLRELFGAASVRKLDCDHTVDLVVGTFECGSHAGSRSLGSQRAYAAGHGRSTRRTVWICPWSGPGGEPNHRALQRDPRSRYAVSLRSASRSLRKPRSPALFTG